MWDTINRIEDKLDQIADRQLIYIGKTEKLEGIVTNGLSSTIHDIKKQLDALCPNVEKRLSKLEAFAWFRDWISELRNNLFKYLVILSIVGGLLYLLISHGREILANIVKGF